MSNAVLKSEIYEPRRPADSLLYQIVNDNLHEFFGILESDTDARGLPYFVKHTFEKFLECGFYENGMTRIGCKDSKCNESYWLPTSCKRRGFCVSCGGRRMNEFAINLDERVIPEVPVRQYVVTVPIPLRYWMLSNHELSLVVNRLIIKAITLLLRKKARRLGVSDGLVGAVTFLQRFGSGLNSHLHYHIVVLDGVFVECPEGKYVPSFISTSITDEDIEALVQRISRCVTKYLVEAGLLEEITLEPTELSNQLNQDESESLSACKNASAKSLIAFGVRSGQRVRRVGAKMFGYGHDRATITGKLCANYGGFSVHAARVVDTYDRDGLRKLISYIARPALSLDRLSLTENGEVRVELKSPWPDGTTALILSPLEMLEKLAALVPYPQKNLVIYSGCLAPNHRARADIVPAKAAPTKVEIGLGSVSHPPRKRYIPWAELLKKTWGIDVFKCRVCGGPTRVMAFISDPVEISKIMRAQNLRARPPPCSGHG
jgi:hypothetical protein